MLNYWLIIMCRMEHLFGGVRVRELLLMCFESERKRATCEV
jgi:hypothetical protein